MLRIECAGLRLRFRPLASLQATERFFLLVRQVMAFPKGCARAFKGSVECDETIFALNKPASMAKAQRIRLSVFGVYKRNGFVRAFRVSGRRRAELLP